MRKRIIFWILAIFILITLFQLTRGGFKPTNCNGGVASPPPHPTCELTDNAVNGENGMFPEDLFCIVRDDSHVTYPGLLSYNMSVRICTRSSLQTAGTGVFFNYQDDENYEVIFKNNQTDEYCITGYVENGKLNIYRPFVCGSTEAPDVNLPSWHEFHLTVTSGGAIDVKLERDSAAIFPYSYESGVFSARSIGGVMILNQPYFIDGLFLFPNSLAFGDINITVDANPCSLDPCFNDGTCNDEGLNYTCSCSEEFTGLNCETDIQFCNETDYPCVNGECSEAPGVPPYYNCTCDPGYTGNNCESELDECESDPCWNNGTCFDFVDGFNCSCSPGYTNILCDEDIDDCSMDPCEEGNCTDAVDGYICDCFPGFTGTNCSIDIDECLWSPCVQGNCSDDIDGYICNCFPGFTDTNCSTDINECASNPCRNFGACFEYDDGNGYTCKCGDDYTGVHCETAIDQCENYTECINGECIQTPSGPMCRCQPGYTGADCSNDIDECISSPCINGDCINETNSFICACWDGWTGQLCETDINNCTSSPCIHGDCTDGNNTFSCVCDPGYTGPTCESESTQCSPSRCQNSGTCIESGDSYVCICREGFTGRNCEADIVECESDPCLNSGNCTEPDPGGYVCECPDTHTGRRCESVLDITTCSEIACLNGGVCVNNEDYTCGPYKGFECKCPYPYTGCLCENIGAADVCGSYCGNGTCVREGASYVCLCPPGYRGDRDCSDIDECTEASPCQNKANCSNLPGGFECSCGVGWGGKYCQINTKGSTPIPPYQPAPAPGPETDDSVQPVVVAMATVAALMLVIPSTAAIVLVCTRKPPRAVTPLVDGEDHLYDLAYIPANEKKFKTSVASEAPT